MTPKIQMTIPATYLRMWRIRLALAAIRTGNMFASLAEWIMPEDLKERFR